MQTAAEEKVSSIYWLRDNLLARLVLLNGKSAEGLAQAARDSKKLGYIDPAMAAKLIKWDNTYNQVRHADMARAMKFMKTRETVCALVHHQLHLPLVVVNPVVSSSAQDVRLWMVVVRILVIWAMCILTGMTTNLYVLLC